MIEILSAYILAVFSLIVTPGPVVALIIRQALLYGFKTAFFTIIGTNFASLILLTFAVAVILGVFEISPSILSMISLLGCAFVFYLGISSLYQTLKNYQGNSSKESGLQPLQPNKDNVQKAFLASFLEGFGIAIGNPKDIIFFVAFFPQFIHISDSIFISLSILVFVWILLDFSILITYAILMQKAIFLKIPKPYWNPKR
ncbi:LysE family translocator [Helicobacter sp. MIT 05-5294]|uniref:LysE family translocator n=1 Tax=Helicobacter sp. MIT 05-5294 TaxID=1548150 RepID=UPI0010FDF6C7|nr:LysE family translocator [Helicobacter sp. MIT 05-5294]TLD85755.1 LysE family translocator [Helicobacter sp. MIT 05-5294]